MRKINLKYSVFFLSIFFWINAYCQNKPLAFKTNLPNGLNYNLIISEYFKLLNDLRKEQNLSTLTSDKTLDLASFDQSHYMDSISKLTHDQKIKGKETPQKRVFYYNGTHDQVGENCLFIYYNKPMKTKYSKELVTAKTEKEIAKAIFLGWKNSPGHYKNMITPGYDVAGLGYYFNKDSSKLYFAQVFGAKPFVPRAGLNSPDNAYHIKESNAAICSCMNSKAWTDLAREITLVHGGDSIYLKCEKLNLLKSFFNKPTDGIYLDYVLREQFVCEKNNLLHGSPIYDGFMTKPVLFKDLFKQNKAEGNNFFATIGPVPKEVNNLKYGLNYGIIKEGYMCQYVYVNDIPNKNLDILHLIPKWIDNKELIVKQDTFTGILKFNIPFERGKTSMDLQQKNELLKRLEIYKPFANSMRIQTFSSIEGSTESNIKLQQERAKYLQGIIESACKVNLKTDIQAKENWEQFFDEIEHTRFSYLRNIPKNKIKEKLQSRRLLDSLDIILRSTRIAQIEINLTAHVDHNSEPYILLGAYQKALMIGDSLNAFACQSRLIQHLRNYKLSNNDIATIEVPPNKKFIAHLTNWVGLATNDTSLFYSLKTRDMAILYSTLDTNYLPLQFNYCIIALKYINELGDTIIPIDQLQYKMYKCYKLNTKTDSMYVDYMLLNYNIMTAYNNNFIHRYDKIEKPLQEIKNYFNRHPLTETEAVKLSLLFNMYGRYSWSLEILYPMLKEYPNNKDILFLFLQTYIPYNSGTLPKAEYLRLLALARTMDKARFNKWIDETFQLLREAEIKAEYCKP